MKAATFLALLALSAAPALAQETLFEGEIEHDGYGAPVVKATRMAGEWGALVGGRGAWVVNHTFGLGLAAYGLVTQNLKADYLVDGQRPTLEVGYGGMTMEYIINPDDLIHITVEGLIGAGGVSHILLDHNYYGEGSSHRSLGSDAFFVAEPGVNVELNVTRHFRVDLGTSYRFVSNVDYKGLGNADLAGFAGALTFKFGSF